LIGKTPFRVPGNPKTAANSLKREEKPGFFTQMPGNESKDLTGFGNPSGLDSAEGHELEEQMLRMS
jgi:hypothetical protein